MRTRLAVFLGLFCLASTAIAQNNALHFDGDDDHVVVANNNIFNVGSLPGFCVMAWVKTSSNAAIPDYTGIVAKANPGPNLGYQMLIYGNKLSAELIGAGGGMIGPLTGLLGTTPLNDTRWHHVALNVDRTAGTAQLYVDGRAEKSVTSTELTKNLDNPAPLLIGVERTKALNFSGTIDQVSLWGRSLPASEIALLANAELSGREDKLLSSFDFNNGYPDFDNVTCPFDNWCARSTRLVNRVSAAGDGTLTNFALTGSSSNWTVSDLAIRPVLAPVFRLTALNGKGWLYTMDRREADDRVRAGTFGNLTVAFHAFASPAPGTVPLDRFFARDQSGDHLYTTSQEERNSVVSNNHYTYEGVMGYVVPRTAAGVVPLFRIWNPTSGLHFYSVTRSEIDSRLASGFRDEGIAAYVFAGGSDAWSPQPFRVLPGLSQISQDIWYVIVNRSYRDNHGLVMTPQSTIAVQEVPRTGDYTAFQWRLVPNTSAPGSYWIVNRRYPGKALDCHLTGGPTVGDQGGSSGQQWVLTAVANNGTDTYSLSNAYITPSRSISLGNGQFSTQATAPADLKQAFTFVAMELADGYFIPGLDSGKQAYPYNKKLAAGGVDILGTGTTSEWAMLRAWVIYQNMILNVKDSYSRNGLQGRKVVIISKDDKNLETSRYPIIMPRQSEGQVAETRGGWMVDIGASNYTYITEEMMCKTGVVNRPSDTGYRSWDQLTHEFGHLLDDQMGLGGGGTPACCVGRLKECFAASVSAWYDTNLTYPCLNANTRSALQSNQGALFNYITARFKAENVWQPPAQLRARF